MHKFNKNMFSLSRDTIGNWLYYQVFDWNVMFERDMHRLRYDQTILRNRLTYESQKKSPWKNSLVPCLQGFPAALPG